MPPPQHALVSLGCRLSRRLSPRLSQPWRLCSACSPGWQRLPACLAALFCRVQVAEGPLPCAGRQHRYVYLGMGLNEGPVNGPLQALGKLDLASGEVATWTRGRQYFVGEPCFVPRGELGTCSQCDSTKSRARKAHPSLKSLGVD